MSAPHWLHCLSVRGGGCYRSVSPPMPETRSMSGTRKKKKSKNFALIRKCQKAHHLSQPLVYSFSYSLSIQVKQHVNRKLNSFVSRSVLSCLNIHVVSAFPSSFCPPAVSKSWYLPNRCCYKGCPLGAIRVQSFKQPMMKRKIEPWMFPCCIDSNLKCLSTFLFFNQYPLFKVIKS